MTTLTTLDILKKGRELIADPARWTKREFAKDEKGEPVLPESPSAVCFCSLGALDRVYAFGSAAAHIRANRALTEACGGSVPRFNDLHTHPEVLAAWDRAIAAEEAKQ